MTARSVHRRGVSLISRVMAAALGVYSAIGADPERPVAAPPSGVEPTVTIEMGDRGGKLFGEPPPAETSRRYFVKAEPVVWDYAPLGKDPVCGKPLPPQVEHQRTATKFLYRQYTDATFTKQVPAEPRLGMLGPTLRGRVGETLVVTFLNGADRPLSMHPHGVRYDKDNEGSVSFPNPGLGAAVGPGARFTYVWQLDEASGPLPTEPSSKGWLYHSHAVGDEEVQLGLIGMIIVTDPKRARPDGTPADVDREMAALYLIFDESGLSEAAAEAAEYGLTNLPGMSPSDIAAQQELGARFAINGYIFGNLPGLEMNEGERVRWYLFGLGSEEDMHTAHWHGERVIESGRRTDVTELLPASMKVADMVASNPGQWLFHCHVAEHMQEGMFAGMTIHGKQSRGVSRAPEDAFLGLPAREKSLQITRAQIEHEGPVLRLQGRVTAPDASAVLRQEYEIQLGSQKATFTMDRLGRGVGPAGILRVLNANRYGVVYGGLVEFDLTLRGAEWVQAATATSDVPIILSVAGITHQAAFRFAHSAPAGEKVAAAP